jgi:DHA2 family multidrug resistance protein-like MFS transporter
MADCGISLEEVSVMNAGSRRWWTLGALALSVLVVGLDLFVLTLALPTLSARLHASSSDLQWFAAAYSLALAAAMLPAGLLGDRLGRKKMLAGALVVFGAASLACAYSGSAGALIAARSVLGVAAAVIMPMALAVIPVMFAPAERSRAIAVVGGATFLGFPIGPILGGWLLDHFWWGSVFLINVPVVVIALIAVAWLMPESRSRLRPAIDGAGVALSSAGLAAVVYGVISAGQDGWSSGTAVGWTAGGAAALAGFVAWERRVAGRGGQPLVDLTLFRSASFSWGTSLSTMVQFALFGITFAMPQYFLGVRGLDSLGSGVRLLPMIGGLAAGLAAGQKLLAPRRRGRRAGVPLASAKSLVTAGFAVMAVALLLGTRTGAASGTGFVAAWFALTGLGLGLSLPTAMNAALGALDAERSGSGSALMTALRQVGGTIGVAVLGTVLSSAYQARLHLPGLPAASAHAARAGVTAGLRVAQAAGSAAARQDVRVAFAGGLDVMLWVCAGAAVAAAVLAAAFLPREGRAPGLDAGTAADPAGAVLAGTGLAGTGISPEAGAQ